MTNAISSYTESMYEAGGGKGGSTGVSNQKGAPGATSTSGTRKEAGASGASGAPGAPGQKWWEAQYKAQQKPTAPSSSGRDGNSRGRDGSEDTASSRGRTHTQTHTHTHEWKVSDPVIKKDVVDAKTKEALQQKLYKDATKEREEQKKEQAKEVAAERRELLEEALKRIAAKEAKKEEEEKLAKHLKELAASCLPVLSIDPYLCLLVLADELELERGRGHFASGFPDSPCTLTPLCTPLCIHIDTHTGGATTAGA
jgi:hypothetical protein